MMRMLMALVAALQFVGPAARAGDVVQAAPTASELIDGPALVVDIREPDEWQATGVLPNAVLVSYRDPQSFLDAVGPRLVAGQPIALICRSGRRSAAAAAAIAPLTEHPVVNVVGGMGRLVGEGYRPAACSSC
ncbi:rhodanese-like domain-containing protein [Cereibacter sphaeroides]|uniref:rhodanese-like domain-containing protein n=1 Tax=Rhodobacterales TaxID=204455 RepID=UPI000BBF3A87|nr:MULTISPECIES: rhodanese-like domain-containing protein [Paracoccaceae]MCE6950194.1 rhodanese-like domain-containing protein [Cereibacter sphaeroides]MCE6957944.1 rhodanese-like domain-containing protein [Cereibacter sphaeroides]MCE6967989.1 rhodanese-like domain-containing protein [Cereibacter sphaeroides]MCE6972305.1 rhodanese-like domain-containing protein [Cereibacter sphaeroides]